MAYENIGSGDDPFAFLEAELNFDDSALRKNDIAGPDTRAAFERAFSRIPLQGDRSRTLELRYGEDRNDQVEVSVTETLDENGDPKSSSFGFHVWDEKGRHSMSPGESEHVAQSDQDMMHSKVEETARQLSEDESQWLLHAWDCLSVGEDLQPDVVKGLLESDVYRDEVREQVSEFVQVPGMGQKPEDGSLAASRILPNAVLLKDMQDYGRTPNIVLRNIVVERAGHSYEYSKYPDDHEEILVDAFRLSAEERQAMRREGRANATEGRMSSLTSAITEVLDSYDTANASH